MRIIAAILVSLWLAVPASAQQPPQDQSAPPPNAEQPAQPPGAQMPPQGGRGGANGARRVPSQKQMMCREQARAQGKIGPDARDSIQMCNLQARQDCLKQAIDQKIVGPARRDFLKSCMNG